MRIERLYLKNYKSLNDFTIDFDETEFATVLVGENGTGKSNLFEAIAEIFADLDNSERPKFHYSLIYTCRGNRITIIGTPEKRPSISVGEGDEVEEYTWARFEREKDDLLPRYVFAYYSGPSNRLQSHFLQHQRDFYNAIIKDTTGEPPPIRRLFYCMPEHSRWVLLAYFLRSSQPPKFLMENFEIEGFDSALLVLHKPEWANKWSQRRPPPASVAAHSDGRFWWSRGVVKTFLQRLWDLSLTPLAVSEGHREDFRSQDVNEERLYLYIPDVETLQRLQAAYHDEAALFAALESTDISNLVRDVRVRVMRNGEPILFTALSEGEKQLLTVIGLMQFTRHDESLFLLDEPDTHLNPKWKLRYLREISRQAGLATGEGEIDDWVDGTSQMILATHDPLTIAGLSANQVQMFERADGKTTVRSPEEDPRGLGVAGVLIQMFGLPTTLDLETQDKIDRRNELARLDMRTPHQETQLDKLATELSALGLAYESRDPDYRQYLRHLHEWENAHARALKTLPVAEQERLMDDIFDRMFGQET